MIGIPIFLFKTSKVLVMKKTDVLNHFGGVSKTAKALGINMATVSCWGEVIPKGRAYQIEVMTGGKLKANDSQPRTAQ